MAQVSYVLYVGSVRSPFIIFLKELEEGKKKAMEDDERKRYGCAELSSCLFDGAEEEKKNL
jgi:hypothetical protein